MQTAVLAIATGVIFLVLDALMLKFFMQPLFARHIGPQLADPIRLAPAVAFYLLFMGGLLYFVSLPALAGGTSALIPALIFGLVAYGTYELTSYTVMRDWHITMVLADMTWGAVLTAVSTLGGLAIARAMG
jgi:uncharacterized membrane protein